MKRAILTFVLITSISFGYSQERNTYLSQVLTEELDQFITCRDSLFIPQSKMNPRRIVIIDFYRSECTDECIIKLSNTFCYDSSGLLTYFEYRNYLIAVYDWRSSCRISFIKNSKTRKRLLRKYPSCEENIFPPHKDIFIKYIIEEPSMLIPINTNTL